MVYCKPMRRVGPVIVFIYIDNLILKENRCFFSLNNSEQSSYLMVDGWNNKVRYFLLNSLFCPMQIEGWRFEEKNEKQIENNPLMA